MSIDRTTLRYEVPRSKLRLKDYLKSEKLRAIQNDKDADKDKESNMHSLQVKMSQWFEDADVLAVRKQTMYNNKETKREIHLGNKSILALRKAALENLLASDYEMYSQELKEKNKAVYVKRI